MSTSATDSLNLVARDVTGQRTFKVNHFSAEMTVSDLIRDVVPRMGLVSPGAPRELAVFRAFLERESRHLHGGERVGDSLREADEITLQPDIQAGFCRC